MTSFRLPGEPDPGPQQFLELSWEVFGELCRGLATRVAREAEPDLVVGIARAGAIPAGIMASVLRCELYTMTISRSAGEGENRERPEVFSRAPTMAEGRNVLIVDGIASSGDTLRLAIAALRDVGAAEIRTATCFARTRGFKPNYFALETDDTLIFPWDRKIVVDGDLVVNPIYEDVLED